MINVVDDLAGVRCVRKPGCDEEMQRGSEGGITGILENRVALKSILIV